MLSLFCLSMVIMSVDIGSSSRNILSMENLKLLAKSLLTSLLPLVCLEVPYYSHCYDCSILCFQYSPFFILCFYRGQSRCCIWCSYVWIPRSQGIFRWVLFPPLHLLTTTFFIFHTTIQVAANHHFLPLSYSYRLIPSFQLFHSSKFQSYRFIPWPLCSIDIVFSSQTSADTWIEKEVRYH
jgi:hypothetical protein